MKLYHKKRRNASGIITCPVCGAEPRVFFRDTNDKEIRGCDNCLERVYADELDREDEERAFWDRVDLEIDRILEGRAQA